MMKSFSITVILSFLLFAAFGQNQNNTPFIEDPGYHPVYILSDTHRIKGDTINDPNNALHSSLIENDTAFHVVYHYGRYPGMIFFKKRPQYIDQKCELEIYKFNGGRHVGITRQLKYQKNDSIDIETTAFYVLDPHNMKIGGYFPYSYKEIRKKDSTIIYSEEREVSHITKYALLNVSEIKYHPANNNESSPVFITTGKPGKYSYARGKFMISKRFK
ncbi:hypothetical protein [Salibacter sp.]|uniref:hypothetical protein n=1 Tax=Salibacter sp. TaxID=2010995 RepID=UPI00287006AF|nr:hypothetical protein [Salibacter sp.]MDR9397733.1 hypothetical protein [Salibacter sp.]MDR9487236.1 hypothetical protein [Salibacter sp.]